MPEFTPLDAVHSSEILGSSGGLIAARALRADGIDTIFALCGGHIVGLLDGCIDAGIRVIDVRHEGAAAFAAQGYSLATGRPGVAAVTAGPGFANALAGFIDASTWPMPLMLIAGRTALDRQGRGAVMDFDQMRLMQDLAKWSAGPQSVADVESAIAEGLRHARAGSPGPVYIELGQDVLVSQAASTSFLPSSFLPFGAPARSSGDPNDLQRALDVLQDAQRPLIVAGSGAFWSEAGEALARFARVASIPIATTSAARGLVPDSDPLCLGSLMHGGLASLAADATLIVGSAFNGNLMFGRPPLFGAAQKIVQIDVRAEALGGNRRADVGIAGDAALTLNELASAWTKTPPGRDDWLTQAHSLAAAGVAAWDAQIDRAAAGDGLHAGALARAAAQIAREVCGDAITFVADGGDMLAWSLAYTYAEGPGRLLTTTTALGTIGVGMPFALGAAVARPDEPVVLLTGDGAFGLAAMEVDTAARHGLPVIVVVSNNRSWGDVAHEQRIAHGRTTASSLADTRYDRLGEALGARGYNAETVDEFRTAFRTALEACEPAVINVRTDPTVLSDLLRNLGSLNLM